MFFEWDEHKNRQNLKKHGISFEEAQAIFDGIVFTRFDDRFDYGEVREISIGAIQGVVIIVVIHTERNDVIRIISARLATRKERKDYYDYLTRET
ncbi:BrnT family toxin [Leptolyngbya sp. NK1-12]|uniref:BrnT family toxin n=1 Tax=Leptolyngbya sp. NK1-12 TaxID=2547451 RepID=A0AA96WK36_9CYAN|nr:BrnT family toxin [Leptolyngbya sp. NK1-12]WNZ26120.1 BrnT family toxin [Leptolyngbya sp. NK1-12]